MITIFKLGEGEALKVALPSPSDLLITADPRKTHGAIAAGLHTLPPGGQLPLHRSLQAEHVLFVQKGQGRVLFDQRSVTVVPGAVIYAPKGAWFGVKNTGTGVLQLAWVASPPGREAFFRELVLLGPHPNPQALQELAARHGIEWSGAPPQAAAPAASAQPASGPQPSGRRRRRRHRGGRGRRKAPPVAPPQAAAPAAAAQPPREAPPTQRPPAGQRPSGGQRPAGRPPRRPDRGGRHHRRRVKEIYMGGKWIQVSGEGPVIAE